MLATLKEGYELNFNAQDYPTGSRRTVVYAKRGMVATGHPLAAQAGLMMLQRGGNAIDAAIATAAALTVVEPTANGIGSDSFSIVWHQGKLHGLNSSGRAPKATSLDALHARGLDAMPTFGWMPVTVPGTPAAWAEMIERFGNLTLSQVLEPAIDYAREGHPVSPTTAKYWAFAARRFKEALKGPEFQHWFEVFTPNGEAPMAGDIYRSLGHATTLESIATSGARDFYEGDLADRIDHFARATGGLIRKEDLVGYRPAWVDPVSVSYRGYDVWELPPNGQGLVALIALKILEAFEIHTLSMEQRTHLQIEATKLAFDVCKNHITDPDYMTVSVEDLLSDSAIQALRQRIGDMALDPTPSVPVPGGTVYLATADGEGNMVSYIQSNYMGFGSGIVVPGTGIALQNRGHNFSMDPNHPNVLAPEKRPYHTIIPGFLTKDAEAVGPFGVMGGFMQPQGHVQVVMNTLDLHMNPQAAIDAPRWQWMADKVVSVERSLDAGVTEDLRKRGHDIEIADESGGFGRGQIIWRTQDGTLAGGTEPRTDGAVAAW